MPPQQKGNKLYDQLLEFFASAIFQMPVLNFIDQNCMIFCSENDDIAEYREVHLQYKALVSALIGAFCEDAKMKYDDFINALSDFSDRAKGFEGTALKAVYEQVLAAENYSLFVNLMLRHNVELQQQCLLLILREIGNLPPQVIAAATGASIETLQALVASAQAGGNLSTGSAAKGSSAAATPQDQELAILIAALNMQDQAGPSGSTSQSKTVSGSSAPAAKGSSTSQSTMEPLPPMAAASSSSAAGAVTASGKSASGSAAGDGVEAAAKVADLVDKMAGQKASYDKKVEQEASATTLTPVTLVDASSDEAKIRSNRPVVIKGSMLDEESDGEDQVEAITNRNNSPILPEKSSPKEEEDKIPVIKADELPITDPEVPKTPRSSLIDDALLSETSGASSSKNATTTAGSGSSSLPPLPGMGGASSSTSSRTDQTSLAAISAMLQPLAGDGAAGSSNLGGTGGSTADLLKNPATQKALEALKNMNADDLVARSEYLKSQRDRLLALKQQQRKNVLDEEAKKTVASRPKSARISKQFVDEGADQKAANGGNTALSPEDEERLRVRRAINESIRREMMGSK